MTITKRRREVFEMLEDANNSKNPTKTLQEYDCLGLRQMCQLIFDPRIEFAVPDTAPPFVKAETHNHPASYHNKTKMIAAIVKHAGYDHISMMKRENIFIGILESIHPGDADLLVAAITRGNKKEKKNHISSIFPKIKIRVVKKAFPEIFPEEEEKE